MARPDRGNAAGGISSQGKVKIELSITVAKICSTQAVKQASQSGATTRVGTGTNVGESGAE